MTRLCLASFLFLFLGSSLCFGQSGASVDLDVNLIRARINNTGRHFSDDLGYARFEVPKTVTQPPFPKHVLSLSTLWFFAIDSATGDTLFSVQQYGQEGTDFGKGALPPNAPIGFQPIAQNLYSIFRDDVENGADDSNSVTTTVKNWPAFYTYNNQQYSLAPIVDENKDGAYNAMIGDYPFMFGDQEIFFAYHDWVPHQISNTEGLGVQVLVEAFAFASNDDLNEMILLRYKVISQNRNLKDFRMGIYTDFDLGNYSDDMVGTDTSRNMVYAYNGDDDDEGVLGYGLNPPAVGVVFLDQPLCITCMHTNLPVWIDSTNAFRQPSKPHHYINLLHGLNTVGDSMVAKGPGIPASKTSTYSFNGDPVQGTGWTMDNDTFSPKDYRMLSITGNRKLSRGDTFELTALYVYARTNSGGRLGGVEELRDRVDWFNSIFKIKKQRIPANCFNSDPSGEDSMGTGLTLQTALMAGIYPNPATNYVEVELSDADALFSCEIVNELGQILSKKEALRKTSLDCSDLPQGIYYIRLMELESGRSITHKLVILRGN